MACNKAFLRETLLHCKNTLRIVFAPLVGEAVKWVSLWAEQLTNPFKMVTEQSEDSSSSTWNVTTTKMLIEFYKENRPLWDKKHKDYGKK